jgi:hypothetical protein
VQTIIQGLHAETGVGGGTPAVRIVTRDTISCGVPQLL